MSELGYAMGIVFVGLVILGVVFVFKPYVEAQDEDAYDAQVMREIADHGIRVSAERRETNRRAAFAARFPGHYVDYPNSRVGGPIENIRPLPQPPEGQLPMKIRNDEGTSEIAATLGVLFIIAGVVAALIAAWWFFGAAVTGRQYHNDTHNQQYQAGLISAERDRAQAYQVATSAGQKAQLKATFCATYPNITDVPTDLADAYTVIC
jgi:hypothetical protein